MLRKSILRSKKFGFWIYGVFSFWQKSRKCHFYGKIGNFELNLASSADFCKNMPLQAKIMCSGTCKAEKHIQSITKPKGLLLNITKIILDNFLQKSKFCIFFKISILQNENFSSHHPRIHTYT